MRDAGAQADAAAPGTDAGNVNPSCPAALADRITVVSVPVGRNINTGALSQWNPPHNIFAAPRVDGSLALAFHDGNGHAVVQRVTAAGVLQGAVVEVAGQELRGFAVVDDVARNVFAALLVARPPQMVVVLVNASGGVVRETPLVGTVDQSMEGARWIDSWGFEGRAAVVATANGFNVGAYHGQSGNFGAMGNHQGDRFDVVDQDGQVNTQWNWGCSHSVDVRLVVQGGNFVPVCLSDCYPVKGIQQYGGSGRNTTLLVDDPDGNCAGSASAHLGSVASMANGVWVSFTSANMRASQDMGVVFLSSSTQAGTPIFLTSDAEHDSAPHVVAYGSNMLAVWQTSAGARMAILDATGAVVSAAQPVNARFRAVEDFQVDAQGNVVWATVGQAAQSLDVHRVCLR